MTFTHALSTNNYGPAKFIVDASAANGTHTTIATALTSASSGDTIFIRPGTYTENLTLKAGVNLCAYECDSLTPNVTISGTCTFTAAGTVSISGIRLQTNSAALLAVTGSAASIVNLFGCYLNCTNNTGITHSSSDAGSFINCYYCYGDLGTTGIGIITSTSAGSFRFFHGTFTNTGSSLTASTTSTAPLTFHFSDVQPIFSTTSTGSVQMRNCICGIGALNTTFLTTAGTGTSQIEHCQVYSGTASALSAGSGTNINCILSEVNSSNTNAITGAGTVNYDYTTFGGSSKLINATTQACLNSSTFTPVLNFGGGTTGITYTNQYGKYTRIDNVCYFSIYIVLSSKGSSTGAATITGLPFTSANDGGKYTFISNIQVTVSTAYAYWGCILNANSATLNIDKFNPAGPLAAGVADTDFNNTTTIYVQGFYFI